MSFKRFYDVNSTGCYYSCGSGIYHLSGSFCSAASTASFDPHFGTNSFSHKTDVMFQSSIWKWCSVRSFRCPKSCRCFYKICTGFFGQNAASFYGVVIQIAGLKNYFYGNFFAKFFSRCFCNFYNFRNICSNF